MDGIHGWLTGKSTIVACYSSILIDINVYYVDTRARMNANSNWLPKYTIFVRYNFLLAIDYVIGKATEYENHFHQFYKMRTK